MILINLLPHREAARKRRREMFYAQLLNSTSAAKEVRLPPAVKFGVGVVMTAARPYDPESDAARPLAPPDLVRRVVDAVRGGRRGHERSRHVHRARRGGGRGARSPSVPADAAAG